MLQEKIDLKGIIVRPIFACEKDAWNNLMDAFHYLRCPSAIGRSMRYAAIYRGEWVAL